PATAKVGLTPGCLLGLVVRRNRRHDRQVDVLRCCRQRQQRCGTGCSDKTGWLHQRAPAGSANVTYLLGPGSDRPSPPAKWPTPPTGMVTYWRPPASYTAGTPSVAASSLYSHNTLPVAASRARKVRSVAVPPNRRPPAGAPGPPRGACRRTPWMPCCTSVGTWPLGTRNMMLPVFMS